LSCMPASSPSCGSCGRGHVSDRSRLCDAGDSPEPSALPGCDGLRSRFRDSPEPSALPGWPCREGAGCAAICGAAAPGCAGSDGLRFRFRDAGDVACPPTTRLRVTLMPASWPCSCGSSRARGHVSDRSRLNALPGWSCDEGAGCANCGDAAPGRDGLAGAATPRQNRCGERGDSTIALDTAVQLVACPPTTRLRVSLTLSSEVCMYNVCTAVQN
jgi:hypothetical protein